jgi:hypothetical protein
MVAPPTVGFGFLPFNKHRFSKKEAALQIKTQTIEAAIEAALLAPASFQKFADGFCQEFFSFKILVLEWVAQQPLSAQQLNSFIVDFEQVLTQAKPTFATLAENTHFALQTNARVLAKITQLMPELATTNAPALLPPQVAGLTYDTALQALYVAIPTHFEVFVKWLNSSLLLEIALITSYLIIEKNLAISRAKVRQVAQLTATAAQNYGAAAMDMGIFETRPAPPAPSRVSHGFLATQTQLAEQGIIDFVALL